MKTTSRHDPETIVDLDALEAELSSFGSTAAETGLRAPVTKAQGRPSDPEPVQAAPVHFLIAAYAANE